MSTVPWRVLVPRPAGRTDELAALLRAAGAEPLLVPLIETVPEDSADLHRAVADLAAGAVDWVAFTSAAAVEAVVAAGRRTGTAGLIGAHTRVAAVGPGTADALRRAGFHPDLVPGGAGSAAALLAGWPDEDPGSVLLPRSDLARPELPDSLRAAGYRVREVVAYRTVTRPVPASTARDLAAGTIDAVLLTSPSTVTALATVPIAPRITVVAIGQTTAEAAGAAGITVTATADRPTATGLVAAMTRARLATDRTESD